jgi:hypothetical protein
MNHLATLVCAAEEIEFEIESEKSLFRVAPIQGDQIWRIFANWAIVYLLWAVFKKTEVANSFELLLSRWRLCINFY